MIVPILLIGAGIGVFALLATRSTQDTNLARGVERDKGLPPSSVSSSAPFDNIQGPRPVKDSKGREWSVTTFHNPKGGRGFAVAQKDPSTWISFFQDDGIREVFKFSADDAADKADLFDTWKVERK